MKKSEIMALIKKLGGNPKVKTPKDAKKQISRILEDEGVPEDVKLSTEEITYIESLGFEIEEVEEDDGEVMGQGEDEKLAKKKSKKKKKKELSQVEPEKKSKKKKNEKKTGIRAEKREAFIGCMTKFIESAKKGRTREAIVEHIEKKMPEWASTTVLAYLSTGKNKKLCRFAKVLIEDNKRRMTFEE